MFQTKVVEKNHKKNFFQYCVSKNSAIYGIR